MYPYLLPSVFGYVIPMYDILIVLGCFLMLLYVAKRLETKENFSRTQTNRLLILIVISLFIALLSSYLFDGIFHTIKEGELTFGSITFLGGLFGGVAGFLLLLKYFYKEDNKDVKKIMNVVLTGVVLAHAFGRIGCFFAGCCYGVPTESFLGVVFPYGHSHIEHPGSAVLPTQLFEAFFLFVLFIGMNNIKKIRNHELEIYLITYGVFRVLIEFIRGDNRGSIVSFIQTTYNTFPTPSQYMSLGMIIVGIYLLRRQKKLI